jgi:hypothetical protein
LKIGTIIEIKSLKLSNFQLKRETVTLRQEKKHLESVVASAEANVVMLEEKAVISETKNLFQSILV